MKPQKCNAVEKKKKKSGYQAPLRYDAWLKHIKAVLSLVGVLLTEVLSSLDHVGEGTLDLIPLASLQTAIRVDPELLRAD